MISEDESLAPLDFTSTFFLALKYLVVKAKNGEKCVFLISLLVNHGAKGIDASAIPTKSRKEQQIDRRSVTFFLIKSTSFVNISFQYCVS